MGEFIFLSPRLFVVVADVVAVVDNVGDDVVVDAAVAAVAVVAVVDNVVVADNVKSSQLNFQTLAACGATKTFPKRENETERVCVWVCVCVYVCRGMSVCVKMYLCEGGCELACVRAREREKK